MIEVGLFAGRHDLPVKNFIFGELSPCDFRRMDEVALCWLMQHTQPGDVLHLYVTGLTAATVAVIKACKITGVGLVLMHFDRESGKYVPQDVLTPEGDACIGGQKPQD